MRLLIVIFITLASGTLYAQEDADIQEVDGSKDVAPEKEAPTIVPEEEINDETTINQIKTKVLNLNEKDIKFAKELAALDRDPTGFLIGTGFGVGFGENKQVTPLAELTVLPGYWFGNEAKQKYCANIWLRESQTIAIKAADDLQVSKVKSTLERILELDVLDGRKTDVDFINDINLILGRGHNFEKLPNKVDYILRLLKEMKTIDVNDDIKINNLRYRLNALIVDAKFGYIMQVPYTTASCLVMGLGVTIFYPLNVANEKNTNWPGIAGSFAPTRDLAVYAGLYMIEDENGDFSYLNPMIGLNLNVTFFDNL